MQDLWLSRGHLSQSQGQVKKDWTDSNFVSKNAMIDNQWSADASNASDAMMGSVVKTALAG